MFFTTLDINAQIRYHFLQHSVCFQAETFRFGFQEMTIVRQSIQSAQIQSICLLWLCLGLFGCSQEAEFTVFGAMSLTDALTEIGEQFTETHGVKVYFSFAASATLQRQVEKGASADVFISASPKQVDALAERNLVLTESRYDVLANRLVLVAHTSSPLKNLTGAGISRIAIGQPEIVPAGSYAKEALITLGVWDALQPKLIYGVDVRATLAYVTAGNVDAAIVYQTDATLSRDVKVLYQFPAETHAPIVYPAVIMKGSRQKRHARQFIDYLKSARATQIFEKHGFTCL